MVAVLAPRIILVAGHGLSNASNGVYDPGASGCSTTEAEIVAHVADAVTDHFFFAADETGSASTEINVVPSPVCSRFCAERYHATSNHLAYVIRWCNDVYHKGDFIISLHMNWSENPDAAGVCVVYDDSAPVVRHSQAEIIAQTLADALGRPNRGAIPDSDTPRRHIGILEHTKAPSLLLEMGFVSNEEDVAAVWAKGEQAVIAVINRIVDFRR